MTEPIRTLLVAVGGTGAKMASAVCERMRDTHGEVPDFVQVVVVDAQQKGAELGEYPPLPSRTEIVSVNPINYPAEAFRLREAGDLDWWPDMSLQAATSEVNFGSGCGAHRSNGHFFARYSMDRIQIAIQAGLRKLRLARDGVAEGSLNYRAFVMASLGNGTGGGTAITVGAMTTMLLDQVAQNPSVSGAFVTSDVTGNPNGDKERQRVVANGVAALLELEHEFTAERGRLSYEAFSLRHGGHTKVELASPRRPFKQVYLFSGTNRSGRSFFDYDEVVNIAGRAIASMVGGVDQSFRGLDKLVHADPGTFSSIGHATLAVPRQELREYANLLAKTLSGDKETKFNPELLKKMEFRAGKSRLLLSELLDAESALKGRDVQSWAGVARFLCRGVFGIEEGTNDASKGESDQLTRMLQHYEAGETALFDLGKDAWVEPSQVKTEGEDSSGEASDAKVLENALRAHVDTVATTMKSNCERMLAGTGAPASLEDEQNRTIVRGALLEHGITGVIDEVLVAPLIRSGNIAAAASLVSELEHLVGAYRQDLEQIEGEELRNEGFTNGEDGAINLSDFEGVREALEKPKSEAAMDELDKLQGSFKRLWKRRRIVTLEQQVLGETAEAKVSAARFLAAAAAQDLYEALQQHLNQRIGKLDRLSREVRTRMSDGGADERRKKILKKDLDSVNGEGRNGELLVCDAKQAEVLAMTALENAQSSDWLTEELAGDLVNLVFSRGDVDEEACIAEVAEARERTIDREVRKAAREKLDVDVVLKDALEQRLVDYVRVIHGMEDLTEDELAQKDDFEMWAGDVGAIHDQLTTLRDLMDDDKNRYDSVEGWESSKGGAEALRDIREASYKAWFGKLAVYGSALLPVGMLGPRHTQKRYLYTNQGEAEFGDGDGLPFEKLLGVLNRLEGDVTSGSSPDQSSSETQLLDIVSGISLEDLRNTDVLNLSIYEKIISMGGGDEASYLPHPTKEYMEVGARWLTRSNAEVSGAGVGHAPLMIALAMRGHNGDATPSPLAPLGYISERPYKWTRDVKSEAGETLARASEPIEDSLSNVAGYLEQPANRELYEALQYRLLEELTRAAFGDPNSDLSAPPIGIKGLAEWLKSNRPARENASTNTASVRNAALDQWVALEDTLGQRRELPNAFGA